MTAGNQRNFSVGSPSASVFTVYRHVAIACQMFRAVFILSDVACCSLYTAGADSGNLFFSDTKVYMFLLCGNLWKSEPTVNCIQIFSSYRAVNTVSVTKISQLMLYREIIAVCSQIHTKHINTLCGHNVELYIKTQSVPRSKDTPSRL